MQLASFPDFITEARNNMSCINQNTFKLEKLKQTQAYVKSMVAKRSDGENYLSIFERLTREINEISSKESAINQIRREVREEQAALISSWFSNEV